MSLINQLLIGVLIALVSGFIGSRIQRAIDNRNRKKDFYSDPYKDLWQILQNASGVIRSGRNVDHDRIMSPICDKYSCSDVNAFLTSRFYTEDSKLKELLNNFSDNLFRYQKKRGVLNYPSMGKQPDYQTIADGLLKKIKDRIDCYLDK